MITAIVLMPNGKLGLGFQEFHEDELNLDGEISDAIQYEQSCYQQGANEASLVLRNHFTTALKALNDGAAEVRFIYVSGS